MSGCDSDECPSYLSGDICRCLPPCDTALPCISKCHCRIEVCPRNRTEGENDCNQCRACCDAVCQERNGSISGCQTLSHNSRADDGGEKKESADELCHHTASKRGFHCRPMLSSSR